MKMKVKKLEVPFLSFLLIQVIWIPPRVSFFKQFQLEHSNYVAMTTSDLKRMLFYVFTSLAKILKISDKNEGLQTSNYSKKIKIKLSKVSVQMTNLKFKS